jgi:hypothetical protein
MKICPICNKDRDDSDFLKGQSRCRSCRADYNKEYYKKHRDKIRQQQQQYDTSHRDSLRKAKRKWRERNAEKVRNNLRDWRRRNQDRVRNLHAAWSAKNSGKLAAWRRKYQNDRYKNNPEFRLSVLLRARMRCVRKAIERLTGVPLEKQIQTLEGVGCTLLELKAHFESLFQEGMTWGNSGNGPGKWNIDHIKPIAAFDLKKLEDQLAVNHYTNLQPLWWEDNMKKRDKWEEPQ